MSEYNKSIFFVSAMLFNLRGFNIIFKSMIFNFFVIVLLVWDKNDLTKTLTWQKCKQEEHSTKRVN